jgi:hypothetical protein
MNPADRPAEAPALPLTGHRPGLGHLLVVGALLPVVTITLLTPHATVVALSANKQRSERARIVLRHLLDTLRALYRCGRSRR